MRTQFEPFNDEIHVIPGGVEASAFTTLESSSDAANEKKIVLMAGRVEDPMKGFATLFAAGAALAERRDDFEIWATHTDRTLDKPWFKAIGWLGRDSLQKKYAEADICVVPSIWEEPFGLVALEAMAAAKPVCASRVGGLQTIVVHEKTGLLFDRGDPAGLAVCLSTLLDDAGLRRAMGVAGRRRAEESYRWDRIIEGHYPALLEAILS